MDMNEKPEFVRKEEKKPPGRWRDSYIVFLVLPVLCILFIPLGGFPYLYGRLNLHPWLTTFMLYPATGGLMICCFVVGIARLVCGWKRHSQKKKALIAVEISIPVLFVLLFVMQFTAPVSMPLWPDAPPHTYGFRDWIRSKADIPAIRTWLRTLDKEDHDIHGDRIPLDQQPESLKVLNSHRAPLLANENGKPEVRITWGGGFFHWGVTIGTENMVIPEAELDFRYESWLLVEPGVYVYDW